VFQTELDIANRALQHCGLHRIGSFSELSPNAQEIAFAYHKLRRAELRRNVWGFATRRQALRAVDWQTLQLVPQAWSATKTYVVGSIVLLNNVLYISQIPSNLNNNPCVAPRAGVLPTYGTAPWTQYFGPLIVSPWLPTPGTISNLGQSNYEGTDGYPFGPQNSANAENPTNGYYAGELVYYPVSNPFVVYLSLVNGNTSTPNSYPQWSATTPYNIGDTVAFGPFDVFSNPGDIPVFSSPGNIRVESASIVYQSVEDVNLGNTPGSSKAWVPVPIADQVGGQYGYQWLALDSSAKSVRIIYPLGSGPLSETTTRNVFRLPNGFLREAPQNPKSGSVWLGAPSGLMPTDWEYNGQYIVSSFAGPLLFRFVADISDVTLMDDMFCEGFAARIGLETVESITQSETKKRQIMADYNRFMEEARMVNGIEQGFDDPPIDDYMACRL
jgi:hypothetical protein